MGSSPENSWQNSVEIFYMLRTRSGGKYRFRAAREFSFSQNPPGLSGGTLERVVVSKLTELVEKIQQELPGDGDTFRLQAVYKDNFEHGRKEFCKGPYICKIPKNIYYVQKIERMVMATMGVIAEKIRQSIFTAEEDIYRNSALEKGKEDRNE